MFGSESSCGRFTFISDMNFDGVFSISDVGLMLKFIIHLPAKTVVWLIEQKPMLASFFEMDCLTGNGWGGSTVFSLLAWFIVIALLSLMFED